ncbi:MAG: YbaB/EbfC family nucleoid-associated protein [Nitrospirota bacterium]
MLGNKRMMGDLMRQAQALQERMAKLQEEAGSKTVQGSAGGGMVTVIANGRQEVLSVKLDPEIVKSQDQEMLQDLIVAGVNDALKKAQAMMAEEMKSVTGGMGLNIPGLF